MDSRTILNTLTGIAIGDAFAAGIEFQDREWIRTHVDFTHFVNARHIIPQNEISPSVFTQNYIPWQYTDDTEMTIGLLEALLSGEPFTPDLLVASWTDIWNNHLQTKGYGRNGHGSMRWVFEGNMSIEEVRLFQQTRPYPGNAPVMRAVPLGFLPGELIDSYAVINADATHPHPKARAASILIARAARYMIIEKGDPERIMAYCAGFVHGIDSEMDQYLTKIDLLPAPETISEAELVILLGPQPIEPPRFPAGIKGLPSDAVLTAGAVLWVLKYAQTTMDGLKTAVYLGGDVDSVAAVCTGILAGRYGKGSIPAFMKKNTEGIDLIKIVTGRFEIFLQQ